MRKILLILMLSIVSFCAHAESINLTCTDGNGSFNISIVTQANKKPKVYQNDEDRDSSTELGITKLTNFSITNSEIKYDVEYQSFPHTFPNGMSTKAGYSVSTFTFNRTSGELTIIGHLFGGLKDFFPNSDGTTFSKSTCAKRIMNKF
jgi:hypothetical protein